MPNQNQTCAFSARLLVQDRYTQTTWEHREDSSKGIELQPVDDIAGVDQLHTHEAEAHHQEKNVQHLWDHRQPQHPWWWDKISRYYVNLNKTNSNVKPSSFIKEYL